MEPSLACEDCFGGGFCFSNGRYGVGWRIGRGSERERERDSARVGGGWVGGYVFFLSG